MDAWLRPLKFANWELRRQEGLLLVLGDEVKVGTRAFTLLLKLIDASGKVVPREELLACWPRKEVEDGNLTVQISALRKVIGDKTIMTIPGIGYRFCGVPLEAQTPEPEPKAVPLPPPSEPIAATGNLPVRLPELIGRESDVTELNALMRRHRVVSVIGAGGIGKTRLARMAALQLQNDFAGGTWLVELAPLVDPTLLPIAVAQALGMRLPGKKAARQEVIDALPEQALLVLDNCEHLVEAVSVLVQEILEQTGTHVMVTSQELLKIPDEQVYRLMPLSVPKEGDGIPIAEHGAIQLLSRRVNALDRRFKIDAANESDAVEICRRLDGLPLAIELAAACVPLLGLAGVRKRLGDRLNLLTGGSRTGLQRHRTLREALAWSHSLLNPEERTAFRRLGMFVGSFGMEQAERVLRDPASADDAMSENALFLLGLLVDKSLVVVDTVDPPRYRLLESARAYALELLQLAGETSQTALRHAQVIDELFSSPMAHPWHLPSQRRLAFFLPDLDNVRAALDWAEHGDPPLHASLAGTSAWLFSASGQRTECLRNCRLALDRSGALLPATTKARLHHELAMLLHDESGTEKILASQCAVELLRTQNDAQGLYQALGRLAISAALCDDTAIAQAAIEEMSSLWKTTSSWPRLAEWDLLNARDFVANLAGDLEGGLELARQQKTLAESEGDTFKLLFAMLAQEQCTATKEEYASAIEQGQELVRLARRERYVEKMHVYIANLATALLMDGRVPEALEAAREAAVMDARHGSLWQSLDMLAMLAFKRGYPAKAAEVLGRADAANAWRGGDFREPVESKIRTLLIEGLKVALSPDELQQRRLLGAALTDEAAAEMALRDYSST